MEISSVFNRIWTSNNILSVIQVEALTACGGFQDEQLIVRGLLFIDSL